MAAPTEKPDSQSVEGRERRSRRKSRSSSRDGSLESLDVVSAPPPSRRHSRSKNSTSRGSGSPSDESRMSRTRSTSRSTKKSVNDALIPKRESSRTSRTSHDRERQEDPELTSPRRLQKSSTDKDKATSSKSYLTTRSSMSQKHESSGRKSSVLGSLHAFLEEGKEPSTPITRKVSDSQSVVSSASRRRRRSHTPSSASVVGGAVMSREELRAQRRSRSSSEGAMDRSRLERARGEKDKTTSSSRKNDSRSRSTSKSTKDNRHGDRSSSRPRTEKSYRKSSGETNDEDKAKKSSWWNLDTKEGGECEPVHPSARTITNVCNIEDVTTRSVKQTRRLSMTSSNGAEIPPGFPVAAVDQGVRTLHTSEIDATPAAESREAKTTPVLESTTQLRERRASSTGANIAAASVTTSPTFDLGTDRMRRRKRQILSGSNSCIPTEKEHIYLPSSPHPEDKVKRTLRQSVSENQKTPLRKPSRRTKSAESLSPERRRRKSLVAAKNELLPASPTPSFAQKSQNIDASKFDRREMEGGFHNGETRHRSKSLESLSPGRRRRKSGDLKDKAVHSPRRGALGDVVNSAELLVSPTHKEKKSPRRSRSADTVSSPRSKVTELDTVNYREKTRLVTDDDEIADDSVQAQKTSDVVRYKSSGKGGAHAMLDELSENQMKENDIKSLNKLTRKKGSGQSVSSVPVTIRKDSKEKKREKRKDGKDTKRAKSIRHTSSVDAAVSDLKKGGLVFSTTDQFNCSMASLDPTLLTSSPSPHKVSSITEIFEESNEVDDCARQKEVDDKMNQKALETLFRESHETPINFNQSTVSFDSKQIECFAAAFGAVSQGSSPSSCGSPGVLKRSCGVSPSLAKSEKRVSWVELPLHDPKQLLLKSTDVDGGNETCTTHAIAQLPIHGQNFHCSKMEGNVKSKEKPNPSLEAAFSREEQARNPRVLLDERTVGTTVTSNTGTTETSEATVKTTNKNPDPRSNINEATMNQNAMQEGIEPDDGQNSLTVNQLTISDASAGSSGSLSGQSKGSRGELTDGSSSTVSEKRRTRRLLSRSNSESGDRNAEKIRRKEGESKDATKSKRSERREKHEASDNLDRSLKFVDSKVRTSQKNRGGKIKYNARGACNDSQSSGEPTEERCDNGDDSKAGGWPSVSRVPSIESDSSKRRKSYLPRKSSKVEKEESKGHKNSINSSLDKFLSKVGDVSPVVKDENRSVYSAIQEGDRRKRAMDKKIAEKYAKRRISRHSMITPSKELDRTFGDSSDSLSVTSAPVLSSSAQSPTVYDERHRPVVDLKKTRFSSKLNRLHVAF